MLQVWTDVDHQTSLSLDHAKAKGPEDWCGESVIASC